MISSTALTVLVVPVIFAGIERLKLSGLWAGLRRTPAPAVPLHPAVTGEAPARAANG